MLRRRERQGLVSTDEQAGLSVTLFLPFTQEAQGIPVTPASEVASTSSPQPGKEVVKSQCLDLSECKGLQQGKLSEATV